MRNFFRLCLCLLLFSSLHADKPTNRLNYEVVTGLRGSYDAESNIFKTTLNRVNKNITVDKVIPDQNFSGLSSWAAFTPADDETILMTGEMILFQDEINPLISIFLEHGIAVTALNTHFFFDSPRTYFLYITGKGPLDKLGKGIKKAFEMIKVVRQNNPQVAATFSGKVSLPNSSLNPAALDKIFGFKGEYKEGMLKYVIGKTVTLNQTTIGAGMGICSRAVLTGIDENAFLDGEIAVLASELQAVLKLLCEADFNIMSISNHLVHESPQLLFIHTSARGRAVDLAKTFKKTLK